MAFPLQITITTQDILKNILKSVLNNVLSKHKTYASHTHSMSEGRIEINATTL